MKFRIFIVNMDRFEASTAEDKKATDFGEWFDLPITPNELGKVICETIGSSSNNGYKLLTTDCDIEELSYFDDEVLYEVNEQAVMLDETYLDSEQILIVNALLSQADDDLDEALSKIHRCVVYEDCDDEIDLGKAIADRECLNYDCEFEDYIRWEDFVYDRCCGAYWFYEGCAIVEW